VDIAPTKLELVSPTTGHYLWGQAPLGSEPKIIWRLAPDDSEPDIV